MSKKFVNAPGNYVILHSLSRFKDFLQKNGLDRHGYLATYLKFCELPITEAEIIELGELHARATFAAQALVDHPKEYRQTRHQRSLDDAVHQMTRVLCGLKRRDYCTQHNLQPAPKAAWCAHRLAGIRCPRRSFYDAYAADCTNPPRKDHPEVFKSDSGALVFTSQPYANPTHIQGVDIEEFVEELGAWASRFGLSCRISMDDQLALSWAHNSL